MASTRKCSSCSDLQQNSPEFVVNGVTDDVCISLQNDTGFNPGSDNDDCTDLNNANDCLIGNMEDEVASYQSCDWKEFMPTFIHNLWTVTKSVICSICGLWKYIRKEECAIDVLMNGIKFSVGEDSEDGSYVAAGKGVSFLGTGTEEGKAQITLRYISGGLVQVFGTIICYKEAFTEKGGHKCVNFDNGSVERTTNARKGNTELNNTYGEAHDGVTYRQTRLMTKGGELLYEIRILKSQYPMIKRLFAGFGFSTGGGEYHVNFLAFDEGSYAYGQHGSCNDDGTPAHDEDDSGHLVPDGYYYVQARMISITYLIGSTSSNVHKYTPRGFMGIRLNQDGIECEDTPTPDPPTPTPDPDPPTPPESVTLTVKAVLRSYDGDYNAVSTVGGTVSPTSASVTEGDTVTVTASANVGYIFRGWADVINGTTYESTSTTYAKMMTESDILYAIFQETSQHGIEITENISGVSFSAGESGTKSATLSHTPIIGTVVNATLHRNGTPFGNVSFVAGTADSIQGAGAFSFLTTSYDGVKTISITVDGTQNATIGLASVTYTYNPTTPETETFDKTVSGGTTDSVTLAHTPANGTTITTTVFNQAGQPDGVTATSTFTAGTSRTEQLRNTWGYAGGDYRLIYDGDKTFTLDGSAVSNTYPDSVLKTVAYEY